MSTTIDSKVVEMRFDNKQFESNVQTSMSTLDKLKQKLNLSGASKGLENVSSEAKKVNFSALGNGIETVKAKFSALEVMGVTALANITNSAVNAGKKMISALTIDPVKTGFQEYETQIGAIQTILANTQSKGSTLQDVNRALDELNTYADKTIYNFTEMTRNIGTFTAAGVDLDTSVSSIKGIANLAAVSGSTSQQASTAMYQLSQALAAGKVQLMDWNSVVNAGMGGELFQNALKRTATHMGTDVDALIKKYGSFRESLTQGNWLTTQVLTETLTQLSGAYSKADLIAQGYTEKQADEIAKLAETAVSAATEVKTFTQLWDTLKEAAQSGWTQSWETIVGDFGEAKELLTGISNTVGDMIQNSADARNKVLSEGLSTGWKQLLDKGISDEEGFKDSIKSVAKEHGIAVDKMIEDSGSFEKSLKQGWLTGDILTESLDKMTKKVSGLSAEQLKEQGYTTEQVKALQDLNEAVKNGTVDMDEFAKKMMLASGRENMIEGLKNIFKGLLDVIKPIKEAFRDIFPAMTGEQLYNFTVKFKELTEHFKVSEQAAAKIKSTFKGLFSVLDIGVEAIKAVAKGAVELISNFTGLGGGILDATSSFGDLLTKLRDNIVEGNLFGKVVDKIVGFLSKAISKIKEFGSGLKDGLSNIKDMLSTSPSLQGFLKFFQGLWNVIKTVGSAIGKALGELGTMFTKTFGNVDWFDFLNEGLLASVLLALRKFISSLTNPIEQIGFLDSLKGIANNVKDTLGSVKDTLVAYQNDIKANTLLKIAAAIGILAASLYVISNIDSDKLAGSLTSVGVLFGELVGSMALLNKINDKPMKKLDSLVQSLSGFSQTIQMIGLAAAVLILSNAMKNIAELDWNGVAKGVVGIAGMVGILVGAAKIMNTESKSITKFAGQMILLSAAVGILTVIAKQLAAMSWEELAKAMLGLVDMIGILVLAAKIMDSDSKSITKFAGQMILMSAAIGILTLVAKQIASMSWGDMTKAGTGLLGLTVILVGAAKIMDSEKSAITKFAGQMILMSAALAILTAVGKQIASMSWEELAKAGAGLLGLTIILVGAAKIMDSNYKSITKFAGQMILMAAALAILVPTMQKLSSMSWEEIGKGLSALGGALAELAIGLKLMDGSLKGSAALIVAATALAILAPTLKTLGSMSVGSIAKSLITLAAAFTIVGVAGYVLGPLVPVLLGLAGAFALFGIAMAGIGVGLLAVSAGFTALATAGAAGATAFVAAMSVIVTGVLGLIPQIARIIGEAIVEIAKVIGDYAPQLAESFLKLMLGVLESLATYAPQITDALFEFVIGVINSLADHIPEFITAAMNLIGQIFRGILDALSGVDASSLIETIAAVGLVTALMYALSGVVALIPSAMAGLLGVGIIIAEMAVVLAAIGALAQIPGLSWLVEEGGDLLQKIGTAIGQFVGGLVGGIAEGFTSTLPQIGTDLSDFMKNIKPFLEGAQSIDPSMMEGVSALAKVILMLTAAEILDAIAGFLTGGSSLADFAEQLKPFGEGMKEYGEAVAGINTEAITASAEAAKALVEVANAIPAEGGLWQLLAGERDLGSFGEKLVPFGEGMKKYAASVAGIDTASITASAEAAKAIVAVANAIPSEGGLWQLLAGEKDLGSFGEKLIPFGKGMKSYSNAVAGLDSSSIVASASAADAIVAVANAIPSEGGLWQLLAGEKDLGSFGEKLVPFGKGMKLYSISVAGIDVPAIIASASAAQAIVAVANAIPSEGGVWQLLSGEKDLASFGTKLVPFGNGMKAYAASVAGIDTASILLSAIAASAIVSVANAIPPDGGFWQLLTGDKDLASFGLKLIPFGLSMKAYAAAVSGIDTASILMSTIAAQALVNVANSIPSEGGFWGWVDGDKDLASFGLKLIPFGLSMKSYADSVAGIDTASIILSAVAAQALINVANAIPSEGGFWGWVDGDKDLGSFGAKLVPFGNGMKAYAEAVAGIDSSSIIMSAVAAQALVNVANMIPAEGGFWSLVDGDKDLGSFGQKLVPFGNGMKAYSTAVADLDVASILASVPGALALVSVANAIPAEGGFWGLIDGEKDLGSFGQKLVPFGRGMRAYGMAVAGLDTASIMASIPGALALVRVANAIPAEGGFWSLIEGDKDLASFGNKLVPFGRSMRRYAEAVKGVDAGLITATASAAMGLVSVANAIPSEGGFWGWVDGEKDLSSFGEKLVPFGKSMKKYSNAVKGVDSESIIASVPAAKGMLNVANAIPEDLEISMSGEDLSSLGNKLRSFGIAMKAYGYAVAGVDSESIISSAKAAKALVSLVNSTAGVDGSGVDSFVNSINKLGKAQVSNFVKAFESAAKQMPAVGKNMISSLVRGMTSSQGQLRSTAASLVNIITTGFRSKSSMLQSIGALMMTRFISGLKSRSGGVASAATSTIASAVARMRSYYGSFYSAGTYVASGFANGIRSQIASAASAAASMANAAITAAKANLKINSPSKVFRKIGSGIPEGFVQGIKMYSGSIKNAVGKMTDNAINTSESAMTQVLNVINSDIDSQPTIRPVVDLSDAKSGISTLNGMLDGNRTIGIRSNLGSINSMMNTRLQNGNGNDEVVSAINSLRKELGNIGNTSYNINGVTYDDGSNIADAVQSIIRAARIERRV